MEQLARVRRARVQDILEGPLDVLILDGHFRLNNPPKKPSYVSCNHARRRIRRLRQGGQGVPLMVLGQQGGTAAASTSTPLAVFDPKVWLARHNPVALNFRRQWWIR